MDADANLQADSARKTADFPFDDARADFILLSSDGVAFHVHSVLLSILSPFFEGLFTLPSIRATKPLVHFSERYNDILQFLSWCDPRCHNRSTALEDLQVVLGLSEKFATESVTKHVENYLKVSESFKKEPFRIFAIAARFRFESLAELCAKETLNTPLHKWTAVPEMRNITAFAYQSLVNYYTSCIQALKGLLDNLDWVQESHFFLPCCDDDDEELEECEREERNGRTWLVWWLGYMDSVGKILAHKPVSAAAEDPAILEMAHISIVEGGCPDCRNVGMEILRTFASKFGNMIDARTSKVKFKLNY